MSSAPYNPQAVARYAPAALVAALLVATALAFAYTESAEADAEPDLGARVAPKIFSPVCRCFTGHVNIAFRLRRADRLDVEIVGRRGTGSCARSSTGTAHRAGRCSSRGTAATTRGRWCRRASTSHASSCADSAARSRSRTRSGSTSRRRSVKMVGIGASGVLARRRSPPRAGRSPRIEVDEPSRVALFVDGARACSQTWDADGGHGSSGTGRSEVARCPPAPTRCGWARVTSPGTSGHARRPGRS